MPADFASEPPAEGLFEATEAESATPKDSDFLSSLIAVNHSEDADTAE